MGNTCCPDSSKNTKDQSQGLSEPLTSVNSRQGTAGAGAAAAGGGGGASAPGQELSPPATRTYEHPAQGPCPPRSTSFSDATIVPEPAPANIQAVFDKLTQARQELRDASRTKNAAKIDACCDKIRGMLQELRSECKNGQLRCIVAARCLGAQGHTFIQAGKIDEGIKLQRRALEEQRYVHRAADGFAGDHRDIATALDRVGVSIMNTAHNDRQLLKESVAYLNEALDMRRRLFNAQDHEDMAQSLNAVGVALESVGSAEDGQALQREGLEMYQRLKGGQVSLEDLDALSQIISPKRSGSISASPSPTKAGAAAPAAVMPQAGDGGMVVGGGGGDGGALAQHDVDDL